jgi:Cu/Ag efflux protein CusF
MKSMHSYSICGAALILAGFASAGLAQVTKTLPGKVEVVTASVEAIDKGAREVTVKRQDGIYEIFTVPKEITRFDSLKVGDTIRARYYENLVLRVQAPGEKAADRDQTALTRSEDKPAATVAHQRTITATITKIDMKAPSITFSGPNGWTYSSRVEDTKTLAKVKVGDKVDITWTEALIVSIEAAGK